jgi:zinc transport system permease protein
LITALMIIPAAAARRCGGSPEAMAILASCFGVFGSVGGLFGSAYFDTPSGPSIILCSAMILAVIMILPAQLFARINRRGVK